MDKSGTAAVVGGGIFVALLLALFLFSTGGGATASKTQGVQVAGGDVRVSAVEANAWAEARAADTQSSYKVYLAAFPEGAFQGQAHEAIGRLTATPAAAPKATVTRIAANSGPSRATIRANCHAYVNRILPPPSKTTRAATGAAAGCAIGALAGGSDGRNCAIGAVAGGATGYVTAGNREKRRTQEYESCVANGGPGR